MSNDISGLLVSFFFSLPLHYFVINKLIQVLTRTAGDEADPAPTTHCCKDDPSTPPHCCQLLRATGEGGQFTQLCYLNKMTFVSSPLAYSNKQEIQSILKNVPDHCKQRIPVGALFTIELTQYYWNITFNFVYYYTSVNRNTAVSVPVPCRERLWVLDIRSVYGLPYPSHYHALYGHGRNMDGAQPY